MPANPLGIALRKKRVGTERLVWARPELLAPENFQLSSAVFSHEGRLPDKYRGRLFAHNISPAIAWTEPPVGTVELVLIVQDADSPFGNPNTHGLAAGIDPTLRALPDDAVTDAGTTGGVRLGKAGPRHGWFGPMPIRSHGPHRYIFQMFALDDTLKLPDKYKLADVVTGMRGHVIGRADMTGISEKT